MERLDSCSLTGLELNSPTSLMQPSRSQKENLMLSSLKKLFPNLLGKTVNDLTPESKIPIEWCCDLEGPVDWTRFFDSSLIQRWASDLLMTKQSRSKDAWLIHGLNILLTGDEAHTLSEMVQMAASQAEFHYLRVPAKAVMDLASNPRELFQLSTPVVVQLEEGPWCRVDDNSGLIDKLPSRWRDAWQTIDIDHPVVFVLCAEDGGMIHGEWRKFGAFDRCIHVQPPSATFLGQRFLTSLAGIRMGESLALNHHKVGLMLQSGFPSFDAQRLASLQLRRLVAFEQRELQFEDLSNLALRGAEEFSLAAMKPPSEMSRKKTAYHEAGHACIVVIESRGQNIPDYCSIVPARDFSGIVMQSLSYIDSQEEFTFENLLLRTRIALAGRAAEEIYFGLSGISSGANSDLSNATRVSYQMFAHAGFHPLMGLGEGVAANLAVIGLGEIDELQNDRIHRDVRQFLALQYEHVVATLKTHHNFIEAIVDRLMWDPVIDQQEMNAIINQFGLIGGPAAGQFGVKA